MRTITFAALLLGLLLPTVGSAQMRRGGFGNNWQGNNFNNGYYGNRGYGYGNGYGNNSYLGFGLSLGGVNRGYYNNGYYGNGYNNTGYGYYNGGYSTPYTYGYSNSYDSANTTPPARSSAYYDANAGNVDNNLAMNANRARVEVITADPNAVLLIQGQRMEIRGRSSIFISPDLTAGKSFTYTIVLRQNKLDDTRTVEVRAGSDVTVDFTKSADKAMPLPADKREEKTLPLPR